MPTLKRTDLQSIPELENMTIIESDEELAEFLKKLRQDWYSPEQLVDLKLPEQLGLWVQASTNHIRMFFAVYDEADNFAKNDDWGKFQLYRCATFRTADNRLITLKSPVHDFAH